MKLNKKVIDSITVCGLCAMLTVTAVTNSGRSEVKAEDKVLANTGLEHTGYNSYAGVAATLFDYEKSLTAENAVTVEKENVEMVATAQDAQQEAQPQLTQEQQEWASALKLRGCGRRFPPAADMGRSRNRETVLSLHTAPGV